MLVREVSFKNWIWHPEGWTALEELQRQVDEEVQRTLVKAETARKLRAEALAMDASEIGRQYLAAMTSYLEQLDLLDAGEPGALRETVEAARVETMRQGMALALDSETKVVYFIGTDVYSSVNLLATAYSTVNLLRKSGDVMLYRMQ